jgi:phosphate transport system ATP-binding protein
MTEATAATADLHTADVAVQTDNLSCFYGAFRAVKGVTLTMPLRQVTAIIGPSGTGKSTFLRSLNRMHEVTRGARVEGRVVISGVGIYEPAVDPTDVRRHTGMIFQQPNPLRTLSIFDNVALGLRLEKQLGRAAITERVEQSLRAAALWDEVKDKLHRSALALSGGQQQRLCIARAIAMRPEVLLMDEPCSALDPISTLKIEELMQELKREFTIVIVTHNMQQASRASDHTIMFMMDDDRAGYVVEYGPTADLFTHPRDPRTEAYITGRIG